MGRSARVVRSVAQKLPKKDMKSVSVQENLTLRFWASRTEVNLEGHFLAGGGTLGAASARGPTRLALSGSETSKKLLITEKPQQIEIALPAGYRRDLNTNELILNDRAVLNVTGMRHGASINGTIVETMSGQASAPLMKLFESFGDAGKDATLTTIPLAYPNWPAHTAVLAIADAQIVCEDGIAQDIAFETDPIMDKTIGTSEAALKAVYDASWARREELVFAESPRLTKMAMRVSSGLNNSSFTFASAVNDTQPGFTDTSIESLLQHSIGLVFNYNEKTIGEMLKTLKAPSFTAARAHGEQIATGLSIYVNSLKPYRVDGATVMLPTGAQMVQAESWLQEATTISADDCDGTAAYLTATINRCARVAEDAELSKAHPFMTAVGNSIGAHYLYGTSVLGASSGHADGANEDQKTLAGHAVCIAIPKGTAIKAMIKGLTQSIKGQKIAPTEKQEEIAAAIHKAMFPERLTARIPENERAHFSDWKTMSTSKLVDDVVGLQVLPIEGTTPCDACLYRHTPEERASSHAATEYDKVLNERISPSIARGMKTLDAGSSNHTHLFYRKWVETSVSLGHELFTSEALRSLGFASAQWVFVPEGKPNVEISKAGATPEQLATSGFSLVPLWSVGKDMTDVLDPALKEASSNIMPRDQDAVKLTTLQSEQLAKSLESLKSLEVVFPESEMEGDNVHTSEQLFSYAALIGNPAAVKSTCRSIAALPNVSGKVVIKDVPKMAVHADGSEAGVFAAVRISVRV